MAVLHDNPSLIKFDQVHKIFGRRFLSRPDQWVRAVDNVSLTIDRGDSFGLVGETGSGKTTLGRLLMRFERPDAGQITFDEENITHFRRDQLKAFRQRVQMIFQNPFSTLNPRRSIRDTLSASYKIHGIGTRSDRNERMAELLKRVGLNPRVLDNYPHQLSGGQRQRVVIARALSVGPEVIVADEPVSALDVSVQAQVLNLLKGLQEEYHLTTMLITHDLRVLSFFSKKVGVMYAGQLVEIGPSDSVIQHPLHAYTRDLIAAAPHTNLVKEQRTSPVQIAPEQPSEDRVLTGCVYSMWCRFRQDLGMPQRCDEERPVLRASGTGSLVACHFVEESQYASSEVSDVGPSIGSEVSDHV